MTDVAFLGEIQLFCGDVPPNDWTWCDGRLMKTHEAEELFSLIGNSYGGDGVEHFALPDLRGRVPIHHDSQFPLGTTGGAEKVQLQPAHMYAHTHRLTATTVLAAQPSAEGNLLAQSGTVSIYGAGTPTVPMHQSTISQVPGGAVPHENMPPYVAVGSYIICMVGPFPPHGGEEAS
jgi:microcystin-dependent protein